ncbi:sensor domain-containing protein [Neorhodopirellula lusitana]|uniref:sensor domain-containing protein n=1 Tax=Neorhodopirellula lusitana TaxID=445327 RepID=UPI00384F1428
MREPVPAGGFSTADTSDSMSMDSAGDQASSQANSCDDSVDAALTLASELLTLANAEDLHEHPADCFSLVSSMSEAMLSLRTLVERRDDQLSRLTQESESMARAQADAIVHSVEIIDELERTKQSLCDARAAAEEAAQDTQRLADTIFEQTNDAVLLFEQQTCVACNEHTVSLLSCDRDSIIGGWPEAFRLATFEDGTSANEHLRECFHGVDGEKANDIEVQMRSSSGVSFWSEVTFSSFSMKGGGHVLAVVRDITARKQFEAELRRHRDFLNNIISAVPDQLSVRSADHRLVLANDAFCEAHAIRRADAIGRDMKELGLGKYAEQIERVQEQLNAKGVSSAIEDTYIAADGAERIASTKHSLFSDAASGDNFLIATSRDITEDRQREERLRLLASVFNGASEGVAILATDGCICEANPAFMSMTSDTLKRSLVGSHLNEALQIEVEGFDAILDGVSTGTPWSGKASAHIDGKLARSLWISLSPSCDTEATRNQVIALVSDITEMENSQVELHRRAMHDSLTGLPNRVYFREELSRLVEQANESGRGISVCFLDLDDFKNANDSLGHVCGDKLLCLVSKRIQQVMGETAFVARFGGDEFALILQEQYLSKEEQALLLEQLLYTFRAPFQIDENEARVGLSIGVTRCPADSQDVDTLMRNADIAMYAGKNAGKNAVREFTPEMQDCVNLRHRVQTKLRDALSGGEIDLYFQPKITSGSYELAGCEALARWRTDEGKFIPPNEFIPIAEQTGLITALGDLVFELAAEQACRWDSIHAMPDIAVNVSPHQLRHPRFIANLESILERTGARPEWFELEITENAMMDDVELAVQVIDQLVAMGFRVAIDDFGTGYSSLSYLKNFNIHTLKIDLSFTCDVTTDRQSEAIVRSITSLGKGLDLRVVAEGVETLEQAKLLESLGCTTMQGYYIGRPMPESDYLEWVANWDARKDQIL